jgi:iron-sulfur cluster assembly protein
MNIELAAIRLTEAAAARVAAFVSDKPGSVGLRFGVRRTGCSGWAYTVDLADAIAADDHVFDLHGVRIVVDQRSLPLVAGTEIDFARKGLNAEFVFRNPNVKGECGCGESFSTS